MNRGLLFILCFGAVLAGAEESMSGYRLKQFGDFQKNWHFVTARYRKDTGELRFTYANEKAWRALKANSKDYPDGAIFAKIGAQTNPDPAFTSSVVPSGARRVQFMVRERRKHSATDGWGYALFDNEGKLFPGDPVQASQACLACHRLVPERGQVFSQIFSLKPFAQVAAPANKLVFADRNAGDLPPNLKARLDSKTKRVRALTGEIAEKPFFGTLDEIKPFLAEESRRSGLAAVLVSKDGQDFSAVIPKSTSDCEVKTEKAYVGLHTISGSGKLYENEFCQVP